MQLGTLLDKNSVFGEKQKNLVKNKKKNLESCACLILIRRNMAENLFQILAHISGQNDLF